MFRNSHLNLRKIHSRTFYISNMAKNIEWMTTTNIQRLILPTANIMWSFESCRPACCSLILYSRIWDKCYFTVITDLMLFTLGQGLAAQQCTELLACVNKHKTMHCWKVPPVDTYLTVDASLPVFAAVTWPAMSNSQEVSPSKGPFLCDHSWSACSHMIFGTTMPET